MFNHDQAFKNLIVDYLLVALQFLFPELTVHWPADTHVTPIRQEQLKGALSGKFRELDIPLLIRFPDGSREALVIVIETESRNRKNFLKYLAEVCIHASILMKTDRVIPAALYPFKSAPSKWAFSLNDGKHIYLNFNCVRCILSKMSAKENESSRNVVARLCLPLMAQAPADKLRLIARACEGLVELETDHGQQVKYSEFILHYAALEKDEKKELFEKYIQRSPYGEKIMTLAAILKDEGKAEGKAEGMAEGMAKGMAKGIAKGVAKGVAKGAIGNVMALYKQKKLSAADARAQLKLLSDQNRIHEAMFANALRRITK